MSDMTCRQGREAGMDSRTSLLYRLPGQESCSVLAIELVSCLIFCRIERLPCRSNFTVLSRFVVSLRGRGAQLLFFKVAVLPSLADPKPLAGGDFGNKRDVTFNYAQSFYDGFGILSRWRCAAMD